MNRKRYTPEQIIGKLRVAEVALSAISPQLENSLKCFDMDMIAISKTLAACSVLAQVSGLICSRFDDCQPKSW